MGSTRANTARFIVGFVTVLVLVPAVVWGIRALDQERPDPAGSAPAAVDNSPRHELGCAVLTAPESLSERTAACETEPPAVSRPEPQQRKPRRDRRRAKVEIGATTEPEACDSACQVGTIEPEVTSGAAEQLEPRDEPQNATDLVGAILAPATRKLPTDPLDQIEDTLDRIDVPEGTTDTATEVLEDAQALVPDSVAIPPELEIQLDAAPAPEPPVAPDPSDVEPVLPDPSAPTALLVLDDRTAEELGVPSRMTIALGRATWRALALLRERTDLELSVAAPSSADAPRD